MRSGGNCTWTVITSASERGDKTRGPRLEVPPEDASWLVYVLLLILTVGQHLKVRAFTSTCGLLVSLTNAESDQHWASVPRGNCD